jgi:hypothetical protein
MYQKKYKNQFHLLFFAKIQKNCSCKIKFDIFFDLLKKKSILAKTLPAMGHE